MSEKRTVGQIVQENNDKHLIVESDHNVRDYTKAMEQEILSCMWAAIEEAQGTELYKNRDFYFVLVKNVDRLLGQPKFFPIVRRSCPTPVYKQDVYKYHHISGSLEFLWTIPSKERYESILKNKIHYLNDVNWRRIAQFVLMMESGELLDFVKKENGELPDAILRVDTVMK